MMNRVGYIKTDGFTRICDTLYQVYPSVPGSMSQQMIKM